MAVYENFNFKLNSKGNYFFICQFRWSHLLCNTWENLQLLYWNVTFLWQRENTDTYLGSVGHGISQKKLKMDQRNQNLKIHLFFLWQHSLRCLPMIQRHLKWSKMKPSISSFLRAVVYMCFIELKEEPSLVKRRTSSVAGGKTEDDSGIH